jgi:hypothetical protein
MAADAWIAFNTFRERVADGTIDLDNDTFKLMLLLSAWTPNMETQSDYADISANEHANANGYTTGGVVVAATWTRSTVTVTFDLADGLWTASGGSITARYAAIYDDTPAGDPLVCYSLLDNSPADVTASDGQQFKVQVHASGVFTLTGMA